MSIDLKPGRELDALVAEKVMGWVYHPEWNKLAERVYGDEPGLFYLRDRELPRYSENMSAVWEVVEKLNSLGWLISIGNGYYRGLGGKVAVQFKPENQNAHDIVIAETAPHAICLAALKAEGEE